MTTKIQDLFKIVQTTFECCLLRVWEFEFLEIQLQHTKIIRSICTLKSNPLKKWHHFHSWSNSCCHSNDLKLIWVNYYFKYLPNIPIEKRELTLTVIAHKILSTPDIFPTGPWMQLPLLLHFTTSVQLQSVITNFLILLDSWCWGKNRQLFSLHLNWHCCWYDLSKDTSMVLF